MKLIKLISKGILFWSSCVIIIQTILFIDYIIEYLGMYCFVVNLLICFGLVVSCYLFISLDDLLTITGAKFIDKHLRTSLCKEISGDE